MDLTRESRTLHTQVAQNYSNIDAGDTCSLNRKIDEFTAKLEVTIMENMNTEATSLRPSENITINAQNGFMKEAMSFLIYKIGR